MWTIIFILALIITIAVIKIKYKPFLQIDMAHGTLFLYYGKTNNRKFIQIL